MVQRCIDDEYGVTKENFGSEVVFWNPVTTVSSNITPLLRLGYNIYNRDHSHLIVVMTIGVGLS